MSKQILERINSTTKEKTQVHQWKNTKNVIDWFKSLEDKSSCNFVQFDIVEFYPSISEELLSKAINYAKEFVPISQDDLEIIMHARKSLLFNKDTAWMKKVSDNTFDVTMGSYDGAEVCELVGLYILSILSEKYDKSQLGLYRDDGLAAFCSTGQTSDSIRKEITKIFNDQGLKITIQANLKEVNFLDVTFNLMTDTYKPYKKPNDNPIYIHTKSNHPPNIIKQLPKNLSKRISDISSSKEIFDKAALYYNNALQSSGYKESLEYNPPDNDDCAPNTKPKNRKRNITWFNPPYNKNVQTNVANKFLRLLDKHFPENHKLHKIFNRNYIKVSYSCMPNMSSIVNSHNQKVLNNNQESQTRKCNCKTKEECPLQGECLSQSLVYRAHITNDKDNNHANYIGLTEHSFKDRLYKHRNSLRYRSKINATELSKYIWNLRDNNVDNAKIKWSVLDRAPAFKNGAKRCDLCLTEKFHIIFQKFPLLNKRNELLSSCRHVNKHLLCNFKDIPPDI